MNDLKSDSSEEIEITDFVKTISIKSNIPANTDYKEERTERLIEKNK